jgi:hypothetical protein
MKVWWRLNKLAETGHLTNLNSCLLTVPSLFLFYSVPEFLLVVYGHTDYRSSITSMTKTLCVYTQTPFAYTEFTFKYCQYRMEVYTACYRHCLDASSHMVDMRRY